MCLSTPIRSPSGYALRSLTAAAAVALLCLATPASAEECADGEDVGVCLDDSTFQWCEDGEIKTANCPDGQLCVADTPWYDGAGCVATDKTDCEDIPAQGECTTANSVVWCDEGTPRVHACDDDSVCGWDDETGWYDCLPANTSAPVAGPDAETDDADADPEEDLAGPEEDTGGNERTQDDVPTPTVTPGGGDATTLSPPPPAGGCSGGNAPNMAWLVLASLLALSRRRERSAATA